MGKMMLIDGNSIINRAFYAMPLLSNKNGEYTNAVYGFLNIFFKFLDEEKPDNIVVAFDLPAPTFRHELFEEYKGTRRGMPDELRPQLPLLKNLLCKMNICIVEKEGFEADDVLGTIAKASEKKGKDVVVISGDRDLLQICSNKIKVRIPKTKGGKTEVEDYTEDDVFNLMGVTPLEYIDVKALMGDTSDNIPGVPGIGEKTALKIIQQFKSVENAIQNAPLVTPKKASENLTAFAQQALLSKRLAEINLDVPIEFDINETKLDLTKVYNPHAFEEIKRLEFKTYFSRFDIIEQPISTNASFEFNIITEADSISKFIDEMLKKELVAYKIIIHDKKIIGISFSYENGKASFIKNDEHKLIELCMLFFDSDVKKIALDLKKDLIALNKFGCEIKNVVFDVMLAGYILNASSDTYEFNDIALEILNETYTPADEFFGKGRLRKSLEQIPESELGEYCARQADVIYRAYPHMKEAIETNCQNQLFYEIEMPLIYVLKDMEIHGIKVDKAALKAYGSALDKRIDIVTKNIYNLAGEEFNINSPKQLGVILFEKLGLKGGKKTKTGYSTAAEVLEKLVGSHEIISLIMEYRTLSKLKSTYVDGLLGVLDEATSKIYSTFNQAVTTTGRISSTEPNLQNIPIRLELGRELRKIFIPTDDSYVFVDADYSQIELRILAHMSNDETFINAFKQGQDIHRLTASQVFKTPYENVTNLQRSNAKAVNFGIVYGIGAYSLSQDLGITMREADRYIKGYYDKYPRMRGYFDKTIEEARATGYATTIFNRRRYIPELNGSNFIKRAFGERVAMNMPVQGSAADIIKIAMVRIFNRLKAEGLKSRLILQVHDELLIEAKRDELHLVMPMLEEEMINAASLQVPLETDVKSGENWFEAH